MITLLSSKFILLIAWQLFLLLNFISMLWAFVDISKGKLDSVSKLRWVIISIIPLGSILYFIYGRREQIDKS
ncbi:MAG: PLDc N-terminal domain-containing protein [Arcicella sp.]|nr:PLDc N-terminal domain-containing protein [Arcicella sp.]